MVLNGTVKTLIWDLDGTVIDSFGIYTEILSEVVPEFDQEIPNIQTLQENFHGSLRDSLRNVLGFDDSDPMLENIIQKFLEVQNKHYEVIEHHIFPDALDLMRRAHRAGMTQLIVSNRDHINRLNASPRSMVERSELRLYINMVISGDDSEHRKPKPEVLGSFINTVESSSLVVIGDQFVDAEFARNLGAKAILVSRAGDKIAHIERLGDYPLDCLTIVKSLSEVVVNE